MRLCFNQNTQKHWELVSAVFTSLLITNISKWCIICLMFDLSVLLFWWRSPAEVFGPPLFCRVHPGVCVKSALPVFPPEPSWPAHDGVFVRPAHVSGAEQKGGIFLKKEGQHRDDVVQQDPEPPWAQTDRAGPDLGRPTLGHSAGVHTAEHGQVSLHGTLHVSSLRAFFLWVRRKALA